jgi:hypothetical protein
MKAALAKRAAEAVDIEATVTISISAATVVPVERFGRLVVEFEEQWKRFEDATR